MDAAGVASDVDGVGVLKTPLLDLERPNILHKISEQGGYAYVRMSIAAAAGDFRAAEAAREVAWEQLHSGPWHSVLPIWRDAYAMACLNVAKIHYAEDEFKEAVRVLDLGLIMGGMSLRSDLNAAIETSCARERALRVSERKNTENEKDQCRIVRDEEYDQTEVFRSLPLKSLSCKIISRRSSLSLDDFMKDYFLLGSPVIISDCMSHWPAKSRWNDLEYLKKVAGFRTVPVEVGKNYLCSDWKQELITFSQFLERIQTNDCSSGGPTYLAQHPLFDQVQDLRKDICIPDYCFAGGGELRSINSWFGPARTVTPLHHDPHHNILAQVVGKKYIRLYPSSVNEDLYPHSESMLCNSSQVDLDDIDLEAFPKVQDLEFMDCILEEGEMLYIPPKWWHYVRSLTISFSVSFWWSDFE
ncbi:lysine-specific demethylase JMJ30 [Impatiens glandulifera]|uniref:lysine-specific demethylase JMJ30 n=1 Tax=Impatiens glandulifera TaxID=253017 RepID=UPI001FB1520D|nr:lysine-specific demethylase JMJ30 [Impatiens glandulifera]